MSSKWKYANIDAETRLKMLREGNSDLFNEEVERTRSITKARRELGLDTTEQENWMDTIGYNYNLWNAKNAGENPEKVSKTGYAKLYLDDAKNKADSDTSRAELDKIERARKAAKNTLEEKYKVFKTELDNEFERQYSIFEEAIINSGASLEGGKAERLRGALQSEFTTMYKELEDEKKAEAEKLNNKYNGFESTLRSYEKNGSKLSEIRSIANALIKDAAKTDGYAADDIIKASSAMQTKAVSQANTSDAATTVKSSVKADTNTEETQKPEISGTTSNNTSSTQKKKLFALTEDVIKRLLENLGLDKDLPEDFAKIINSYISKSATSGK